MLTLLKCIKKNAFHGFKRLNVSSVVKKKQPLESCCSPENLARFAWSTVLVLSTRPGNRLA